MTRDEKIWNPSEIRRRYESGERDFQGLDISDPDDVDLLSFRDARLDGADFSRAFVVADFRNARLRECKFVDANVKTCNFDGADLQRCDFSGASIDAATFRAALLEGATFEGAGAHGYTYKSGEVPDCD